jgi:uncharacterized membrane protein YkoI
MFYTTNPGPIVGNITSPLFGRANQPAVQTEWRTFFGERIQSQPGAADPVHVLAVIKQITAVTSETLQNPTSQWFEENRMRLLASLLFLSTAGFAADKKVKMEDLPAAVQAAVKEQAKSATVVGLAKEIENGKTMYEVETKVNGQTRDLLLDSTGAVVEVEQEVDLSSIPPAAKAAIEAKAAGGTIKKVETVTKGSAVSYEAAIQNKTGKNIEVAVNADGSVHK